MYIFVYVTHLYTHYVKNDTKHNKLLIFDGAYCTWFANILPITGWETSARPLNNVSESLAGGVENRFGRVEFCIGYIKDYPVWASAKIF